MKIPSLIASFSLLLALNIMLLFPISGHAQGAKLVCAPIIGAQTAHGAKVWTMVAGCKEVQLKAGRIVHNFSTEGKISWQGNIPVTFQIDGIPLDSSLEGQFFLDGVPVGQPFAIPSAPSLGKSSWSFMVGSCAFYGLGATRAIKPGRHVLIFDAMLAHKTDFMVWLGDNVYLLNGEWNDLDRMYEKYTKVRLEPHTNAFLLSRPQYAILDDHDYGPDNAEGNFPNKAQTSACFRDFWPNPYFGNGEGEGTNYHFDFQDASFFMLDDRWFRRSEGNTQVIGPNQMNWLKAKLKASRATFKFIGLGSQVVSEVNAHETWSRYPERQQLLDFIRDEHIPGVIFLSGDRHFTELCRLNQPGLYPIYDFTSSPISSIIRKRVSRPKDPEYDHALRVPGTKYVDHNFGKVVIGGPHGARTCVLETYDAFGKLVWRHEISQQELGWSQ